MCITNEQYVRINPKHLYHFRHSGVLQPEEKRVDVCDQHGGASLWTRWNSSRGPHVHLR